MKITIDILDNGPFTSEEVERNIAALIASGLKKAVGYRIVYSLSEGEKC